MRSFKTVIMLMCDWVSGVTDKRRRGKHRLIAAVDYVHTIYRQTLSEV